MRYRPLRHAVTVGVAALILSACSDKPPVNPLLNHVPADTPYLFSVTKPLPDPLYRRMVAMSESQLDKMVRDSQRMADELARIRAEQGGESLPPDADVYVAMSVFQALAAELQGKLGKEGQAELGFVPNAKALAYGLGPFPVMRGEIADAAKVEALLQRIEQRSQASAPRASLAGQDYRRIPLGEELLLVVAVREQELVVGMLPTVAEAQLLPLLLGQQLPDTALTADTLTELQSRYGFAGYGEGYVDFRRLAHIFTGRDAGPVGDAWRSLSVELPQPSPGCQSLVDGFTDGVPRLALGITDVQDHGYGMTAAYETSPAVAVHLQKLARPKPLPGMGLADDAMFSMGMDIDVPALRAAIKALMGFMVAEGGNCEWLEPQAIQAAMPKVDFMLGPMLGGLSGMYAQLTELHFDEQTLQPDASTGGLLLAVSDPRGLVAMAAMMNPELAQLQLPEDGSAVAVPAELLPPQLGSLHLAAADGLLAMATGEGSAQRATAMLKAGRSDQPLLLAMGYDMGRFMGVMERMMGLAADRLEAMGEAEQAQAVRDQADSFKTMGGQFGRIDMRVAPDAGGLIMQQQVELR